MMGIKNGKKTGAIIIMLLLACTGVFHGWKQYGVQPPGLIRLHVVANSNTFYDQDLKYQVKDRIVEEMSASFKSAADMEEARAVSIAERTVIERIARDEIRQRGYDYPVRVEQGTYYFPVKTYTVQDGGGVSRLTLSPGRYEAVRVIIGSGRGANWWCVLFPPLCFTDVSRSQPSVAVSPASAVEDVDAPADKENSGQRYSPVVRDVAPDQQISADNSGTPRIEYRFRILEWWQRIFS